MKEKITIGGFSYINGISYSGSNYQVRVTKKNGETRISTGQRSQVSNRKKISKIPFLRGFLHLGQILIQFWPVIVFILFLDSTSPGSGNTGDGTQFDLKNYLNYIIPIAFFVFFKISNWSKYHGAEHKALNLYFRDKVLNMENMKNESRITNSCLTTVLVSYFTLLVLSRVFIGYFPLDVLINYLVNVELLSIQNKPVRWIITPILWVSNAFQYLIYTSEPLKEHNELALAGIEKLIELEGQSQ